MINTFFGCQLTIDQGVKLFAEALSVWDVHLATLPFNVWLLEKLIYKLS